MAQDHRAIRDRRTATPKQPPVLRYSTLTDPTPGAAIGISGYGLRIASREADFLQLGSLSPHARGLRVRRRAGVRRRHRD